MRRTHADWESLRTRREAASYALALAVRDDAVFTARQRAETVLNLTAQMDAITQELNQKATK